MATQRTLFPSTDVATTEPFVPVFVDATVNDQGNNRRPPGPIRAGPRRGSRQENWFASKLRLSTMGNTRKVSTLQIEAEADADTDLLHLSKPLLDSADLHPEASSTLALVDPHPGNR